MIIITTLEGPKSTADLTPAEMNLIAAHRKMGNEDQEFIIGLSTSLAEKAARPALRLIPGGAA